LTSISFCPPLCQPGFQIQMYLDLVPHSNQGWFQEQVQRQYFANIAGVVVRSLDISGLLLGWDRTVCTYTEVGLVDLNEKGQTR